MNIKKEENNNNKELNHDLLANQFFNDDNQSNSNSLNLFKNKSADAIYKNESIDIVQKNQYHNIYFALLYLISTFIVGISCAYYFSYNNYNNRIFLPVKNIISLDQYPFYKIVSKYTKGNSIYIKLEIQESPNQEENEKNENNLVLIRNLNAVFEFYIDSVHFKITSPETKSNLEEENLYNLNDIDYSNKKINNFKDSNINISISDYPFNFFLQRKEDGAILFNSDCGGQNLLFYSKNYIQLCTKADEDTYFFGLGDDLVNHGLNLLIGKGQKYNLYSNISDIMPFILSYNKYNMTSSGILLLNSGPMRVRMYMDQISIRLISGEINMHILAGSTVKQAIMQTQNSLGLSMIPNYLSIDWNYIEQNTNKIKIRNNIDLDKIYLDNSSLVNYFNFNYNELENKESKQINSIFLDSNVFSKDLEDLNSFNYLFLHKANKIIKNDFMLNNLNTIGLQECKYYNNLMIEGKQIQGQSRPFLFSSRAFIDSSTFSYKLIKDIPFTFEGIRLTMNKLKSQSLFGNPYCYIEFEPTSFKENKNNKELVLRWSQLLSILPFANINNLDIPLYIKNFRYIFSIYIYVYYIVISTEGGTYFRPLFYDLKSNTINEDLISKRYEIMLGSNILIEPIFYSNLTNMTTLFPEDKFYDFYTGKYINKLGDGYYQVSFEKYKLPLFLRGGKITPVQLLDELYDVYLNNNENNFNDNLFDNSLSMEKMKDKPLQLLIALDNNLQAQGRILLDDFISNDSKKKKNFYKMLITVSQRTSDISIFFRVYSFKYNLPINLFKNSINRLIIYGFTKMTVRKITIMNKNGRQEIDKSKIIFSQTNDVLTIPYISIPLNMDTKILIV